MMSAGYWREPYVGLLDPALYAGVLFGAAAIVLPAMFALLHRARRETSGADREQDGAGTPTRSGCGSPARCTTWSATACR